VPLEGLPGGAGERRQVVPPVAGELLVWCVAALALVIPLTMRLYRRKTTG
jgi:hypothetical protein